MRRFSVWLLVSGFLCSAFSTPAKGQIYNPPAGGWTYIYTGDAAATGADFTALDGTWSHDNGSDSWDESIIGTGSPGGVTGGLMDGATVYARFQETGDPRDFGMPDPSNRKLYFGHDISAEGATDMVLDDGITISFRARVATGGTLDPIHPDGGGPMSPWPAGGVGYNLHNGSKSTFTVKQASGGSVSFALGLPSSEGIPTPGLIMNNLNGTSITGAVDGPDDAGQINLVPLRDATEWHEFWITIASGGAGTHQVRVYRDGTAVPKTFDVTAGDGSDYGNISYLAMGLGATPRIGAFDVDFFAWAPGVIDALEMPTLGDFNLDGRITTDDYFILSNSLAAHLDREIIYQDGDFDADGDIDLDDFGQFKAAFPAVVAAAQGIPEPSTLVLMSLLLAIGGIVRFRAARLRPFAARVLTVFAALLLISQAASAQVANSNWTGGTANYNSRTNWSVGAVPDALFDEVATINNGGTAIVSDTPVMPGGVVLGQSAGNSGSLEIQSGGMLSVVSAVPGSSTPDPPGTIVVGMAGEGHLTVLRGGTLSGFGLSSGGAAASSVVLGQTGGSGTATVNITGPLNLQRTTHIIGPNASLSGSSLSLGGTHDLIAEITGPTHSAISVSGNATLGGTLNLEFNGHTPTAGQSWSLIDASNVSGSFSAVNSNVTPDPGFGFFVDIGSGGANGKLTTVSLDTRLQLSVDRMTGNAALENLTSTTAVEIDGYLITSLGGTLTPGGWNSLASGNADWRESNAAVNHIGELNLHGSQVIGPNSSVSLGTIFTPPGANGTLDNVRFDYHKAGGNTVQGLLALVDMPPPEDLIGDYNASGQVEQGDLDLVLLNWGSQTPPVPGGWTNDLPQGVIDQAELDKVLLNWGNTAALGTASVPEPASWTVALLACLAVSIRRILW